MLSLDDNINKIEDGWLEEAGVSWEFRGETEVEFRGQVEFREFRGVSAFTGNYGTAAKIAQVGNILAGPLSGFGTLLGGGSAESAERNAGIESIVTAGNGLVQGVISEHAAEIVSNYGDASWRHLRNCCAGLD